ncbi:MAG TPA: hypothetical protein PLP88_12850, partial [Bacteroidales bacterium]|nr:hypothetical protein [Bacteroidales bacterium]
MTKRHSKWLIVILLTASGFSFIFQSCQKEEFNTGSDFKLEFSNDTVIFDTVFTSIGTATQALMVYNNSDLPVKIASVSLAGGSSSPYRINIDGDAVFKQSDLEIAAKDSLYIFVKVTIDPNNTDEPLIRTDSILFETNGNLQEVKLVAWGQDAYFHNNDTLSGNVEFTNNKPHVIYGNLVVDSLSMLTVDEGVQLCFHKNSGLIVRNTGTLKVNGTLASPVVFRSDTYVNFDPLHDTVPGMWNGLWLQGGSGKYDFTYAEIRNSDVGIMIDSCNASSPPALTLYNCKIRNTTSYGLYTQSATILAANCEFSNSGGYLLCLQGGSYDFRHCTFANYWQWLRKTPSVYLRNSYEDILGRSHKSPLNTAYFGNSIVYGTYREDDTLTEVIAYAEKGIGFNFTFDNCLVINNLQKHYSSNFSNCIMKADSVFMDTDHWNFELDTLSPALNIGSRNIINFSVL